MSDSINCSSCGKVRKDLFPKKSPLMAGVTLYMCQTCINAGFQPRWVIILHARKNGIESVSDYLRKHRYIGRDIIGSELV